MFTIYRKDNGQILRISETPDCGIDESFIEGSFSPDTYYIKYGEAIEIPPSPTGEGVFDHWVERWVEAVGVDTRPIIQRRNKLLSQSDWTQMPDVTLENKASWAAYRQALRDLPAQPGFPQSLVWPVSPADVDQTLYTVGTM